MLPKLLAAITVAAPFIAASALLTSYIAFPGDLRAVTAVTVSALVGVALYASAFVWLGLVSTHAIGVGCSASCSGRDSSPASSRGSGF